jgi:hypothetical protein
MRFPLTKFMRFRAVADAIGTPVVTRKFPSVRIPLKTLTKYRGAAGEIGLPLVTFYTMHFLGATDWVALLSATFAAGARLLYSALHDRTWSMFSTMMLISFSTSLTFAVINQDPRYLVLKGCLTTTAFGIAYLVSVVVGHPLSISGAQAFKPDHAKEIRAEYERSAFARHCHRVVSLVWGFGLLGEGLIQIPVILGLPIAQAVGISATQSISVTLGLIAWNLYYEKRQKRRVRDGKVPAEDLNLPVAPVAAD